ncbi:MAG: inositol monophosphatase [Planctomycetota bacterium]|jgi:fructose-1,6-bisphosphatase/inositol monophosphatase family enzyme|nr:inositol monophosphatase [Planctomycetota bacterium]
MKDIPLGAMLETAVMAARRAGDIQRDRFGGELRVLALLEGDIKLEADQLCEAAIMETIRSRFPDHAVLAEEGGKTDGAEFIWYVDPLDGTVNYYFGIPHFCSTLACYRQSADAAGGLGVPVIGVTYAVMEGGLYCAAAGRGATANGVAARVREEESLEDALVIAALGNTPGKLVFTRQVTLELSKRIRKTRNLGAAALDLAYVASGKASAFVEYGVNPWDVAAGVALVEAAGGKATVRPIRGRLAIVASGRNIHDELVDSLSWYDPEK